MKLPPLPSIKYLLDVYQVPALASLSQNFLLKEKTCDTIVGLIQKPLQNTVVVEVGPGPSGLTRALLNAGVEKVIAVEKDTRFQPFLSQLSDAADGRLQVIYADMLQVDNEKLVSDITTDTTRLCVVGNLPFNVASPLLINWLKDCFDGSGFYSRFPRTEMLFMFQKEVAQGICAAIDSKERTRLSCISQIIMDPRYLLTVSRAEFTPRPRVDSGIVHFKPRSPRLISPNDISFEQLEDVLRQGWNARSKTLSNNFQSMGGESFLRNSDIDPMLRPRNLSSQEWARLAKSLKTH